jgi:hypothetical protein
MRALLLLLLLPLTLQAQVTFGPLRLSHGQPTTCYFPLLELLPQDTLLCLWSPLSDTTYSGHAQRFALSGTALSNEEAYNVAAPHPTFFCAAEVSIVRLPSGGEGRVIHHG